MTLPVVAKSYPEDLLAFARAQYPMHDWVQSRMDITIDQLEVDWRTCRDALRRGPKFARERNVPFGRVLASSVDGRVVVPRNNPKVMQEFHEKGRYWTESPFTRDDAQLFARKHINVFAPVNFCWRDGKLTGEAMSILPDPLLSGAFCSSVATEAVMHMKVDAGPMDDPEAVRHQLLFACGTLYDFRTDSFRRGEPADRIHRHLPWAYVAPSWPEGVAGDLVVSLGRLAKVPSVVAAMQGSTLPEAFDRAEANKVTETLARLAEHDEFVRFLLDWTVDVDEALLWLKWLARGASSHPRFTEAVWLVGAAQGGKDIAVALIQAFGGVESSGIVAELKWKYVTNREGGGTETCAPFLRACTAARFIIVSEVPNKHISIALLKPLCEQRGARIAARTLYEGSHGFRPMALPILTSNFTPKLNDDEADDSGAQTRVRVYSTTAIYTNDLQLPTHKEADVKLADRVNSGRFNASLFALMRIVYPLLDLSPETRNVGPLPQRVREETAACFNGGVCDDLFQAWMDRHVRPGGVPEASPAAEVYDSAVKFLGETGPHTSKVRAWLTSFGFKQDNSTRSATKRYYVKSFGGVVSPVCIAP